MSSHALDQPKVAPVRRGPGPMARAIDTTLGRGLIQIAAVAIVLACWQAAVDAGWLTEFLVGAPLGIWRMFHAQLASGDLAIDTWTTLVEAILGFVIGTVAGSAIGLGLWYSTFVARVVEPFIVAINSVPKIALAPIVILWFGTGLVSKVALAVSLTALVALIAAYGAARDADPDLQALLASMGATKNRIFRSVIVPSTLPAIIGLFRINIGFALVGAVVGEFISSQRGLGHMIYTASSLYDLDSVWVGLFVLMAVGFVLYHLIDLVERRILPWRQVSTAGQVQV
ncbi:ABC transporter permease [Lichenibacterium ramalinae]|uniref:ABC transporter permease n=1 Tax=Lichenibacterium ramalinae TaxID=2316527 RepID=A0A4V1RJ09_9HYPH|nr:ABC transporter permease [Lichenibacterium ramalinae]RYB06557.1 ABC transporter permease [Lichenibacterium ramalinae]